MGRPATQIVMKPIHQPYVDEFPELMTLSEAAKQISCSARHLRDAIARGDIVAYRLGRGWKLAKADLIEYTYSKQVNGNATH